MQTIFFTGIAPLEQGFGQLAALLSPGRQQKIRSYLKFEDRLRCLAGGLLIDHIGRGKNILYNEYGKPFIPGGPHFNLSHSGDFACLAVSDSSPVGIDIEKQADEDYPALAQAAFHPAERAFFLLNPIAERFFALWTLKESYAKMLGAGFSMDPREFCILPRGKAGNAATCMSELPEMFSPENDPGLFFHRFNLVKGYSLSLCTAEPVQVTMKRLFF
jgi:4'-phosphopantetheinyl transferase